MSPVPKEVRDKPPEESESNGVDSVELPDVFISQSGSDSDDDPNDFEHLGYELLSQEPGGNDSDNEFDNPDELINEQPVTSQPNIALGNWSNFEGAPSYVSAAFQVQDLPKEKNEMLWNQPRNDPSLSMDTGHIDKIKVAMAGIQLPSSNIPEWAQSLSDDQWLDHIHGRLGNEHVASERRKNSQQPTKKS